MSAIPNYFLWGACRGKQMQDPRLTKNLSFGVKKVVMGDMCILALANNGRVYSWGRDANFGCLGQGSIDSQKLPTQVQGLKDVVDIQIGPNHVVALTKAGEVFTWGNGDQGQLGNNLHGDVGEVVLTVPTKVQGLPENQPIQQILVVRKSTFALTSEGLVYAWGNNAGNILGLKNHHVTFVDEPVLIDTLGEHKVARIEVFEMGTIIAYIQAPREEAQQKQIAPNEEERSIYEGIGEMSRTLKILQDWWTELLALGHGQPYDLWHQPSAHTGLAVVRSSSHSLSDSAYLDADMSAPIKDLEHARDRLESLCVSATARLESNRNLANRKNVKFILCLFLDQCRLREEKVRRTLCARRIADLKRSCQQVASGVLHDLSAMADEESRKIVAVNHDLEHVLDELKKLTPVDVLTQELKSTLWECIECRVQLHEARIIMLEGLDENIADKMMPGLKIVKDRWEDLKSFSLYAMLEEHQRQSGETYGDESFNTLVQNSNAQIDQILYLDDDSLLTHDLLIPPLCYQLLRENAELRKMANLYQLQVLWVHSKRETRAEQGDGDSEYITSRADARMTTNISRTSRVSFAPTTR